MASTILKTRILSKFDYISAWNAHGDFIPMKGEIIFAYVPSISVVTHPQYNPALLCTEWTPPEFLMKVGDGTTNLSDLQWITAKAGDVYSWAKKENLDWDDMTDEFKSHLSEAISVDYKFAIQDEALGNIPGDEEYTLTAWNAWLMKNDDSSYLTSNITIPPTQLIGTEATIEDLTADYSTGGPRFDVDPSTGVASFKVKTFTPVASGGDGETYNTEMSFEENVSYSIGDLVQISSLNTPTQGYLKTYTLMRNGYEIPNSRIDIPKDFLLSTATAQYVSAYNPIPSELSDLNPNDKVIDFVINTVSGDVSHIYIPVKELLGDSLDATVSADAAASSGNYFNVLSGATVTQNDALLTSMTGRSARLNKIALEGNAKYLTQEEGDFLILNCGSAIVLTDDLNSGE